MEDKRFTKESNFEIVDMDDETVRISLTKEDFDRILETPRIETIPDVFQIFETGDVKQLKGLIIVPISFEIIDTEKEAFLKRVSELYAELPSEEKTIDFNFPQIWGEDLKKAMANMKTNLEYNEKYLVHHKALLDTFKTINNY